MIGLPNFPIQIQVLGCLAFAGDLSMGQPVDHSPRTALLAHKLSAAVSNDASTLAMSTALALLRWAGCTANAREFSQMFGDDIAGRAALIENRNPFLGAPVPNGNISLLLQPLALAHCEAAAEIAEQLELPKEVGSSALDLFENWDGSGLPQRKRGEDISLLAQIVHIAGELEVLARVYGVDKALQLLETRAGIHHDPALYVLVRKNAAQWLAEIEQLTPWQESAMISCSVVGDTSPSVEVMAGLLADFGDLKAPAHFNLSRRAAAISKRIAETTGLVTETIKTVQLGALLHGLGRCAVPNATLERQQSLSEADVEHMRLIPHWTGRILRRAPALTKVAELAVTAFERIDGSGYPRGRSGHDNTPEMRIIQVSVELATCEASLRDNDQISTRIKREVEEGKLDPFFAKAGLNAARIGAYDNLSQIRVPEVITLTTREQEVLTILARGLTNKEIARALGISPKTAGSHVENIYRKLGVGSRAAATLKAVRWHLLSHE
jgi:HD-GYP domain-containing protein (c-di-GMP phosphodiesterase class II)/DNA-binding CsgD family transcriptional regulator